MDTTSPASPHATCFRCQEPFVRETLYLIYLALMTPERGNRPLADRLLEAPANIVSVCGDCANTFLGGNLLTPSVPVEKEQAGAVRLRVKATAPPHLIPDGHRPGDTVGFPTGGTR